MARILPNKRHICPLLPVLALFAASTFATETHGVRLLRPLKAGDRFEVAAKVAFEDGITTSFDGKEVESDKTVAACRMSGVLTVGSVTAKGLPKELRVKLSKVECVLEGRPAAFLKNGVEVTLRRDEPENETLVNGEPADDLQAQVMESVLSVQAEDEVTDEDIFWHGGKGRGRRGVAGERGGGREGAQSEWGDRAEGGRRERKRYARPHR